MPPLTIALLAIALILLFINIVIDIKQGDILGIGYLSGLGMDGFTPLSNDYSAQEAIFQPEGYGMSGIYNGIYLMPYVKVRIDPGGIPRSELKKIYPADHDIHLITD